MVAWFQSAGLRKGKTQKRTVLGVEAVEDRSLPAADAVLTWNNVLLDAVRATSTPPPKASRAMAIVHIAIFDAINSIHRNYAPYHVQLPTHPQTSPDAAVAGAAKTTLLALFPTQASAINSAYASALTAIPDGTAETNGVKVGSEVGTKILALRSQDGSTATPPPFLGSETDGLWRPTPAANAPGLLPAWGKVTTFGVRSVTAYRPPTAPSLTSEAYRKAYDEVFVTGAADAETADRDQNGKPDRTPEQTAIAKFWANGAGTATPPGHWNLIAQAASGQKKLSTYANARLFALLNIGLADAAICCWDAKYVHNIWRPVTAIRDADDGNPNTVQEANWTPLLVTPPFPSYTSGHSTFSAAGAEILRKYFHTDFVRFTVPSENESVADRSFTSFSQAARESGQSRIYGGIHFQFDNLPALAAGKAIAAYSYEHLLQRVPELPTTFVENGVLMVTGTRHDDMLRVEKKGSRIEVFGNGVKIASILSSTIKSIVIDARAGNDTIRIGSNVTIAATLIGGTGDDVLIGGGGKNTLRGGTGRDLLVGKAGDLFVDLTSSDLVIRQTPRKGR